MKYLHVKYEWKNARIYQQGLQDKTSFLGFKKFPISILQKENKDKEKFEVSKDQFPSLNNLSSRNKERVKNNNKEEKMDKSKANNEEPNIKEKSVQKGGFQYTYTNKLYT